MMEKQVTKEHYHFSSYLRKGRWMSYWHQLEEVISLHPQSVLIVGTGDNIIKKILQEYVPVVKVLDIDAELSPDYVGSVEDAAVDRTFDCVLCCQVLEHLPFDRFESCIRSLHRIASAHCVLSLPMRRWKFGFTLTGFNRTLKAGWIWKRKNVKWHFDGEHYWEIGTSGCPEAVIRTLLEKYFRILRCYSAGDNGYHRFYILEKN